MLLKQRRCDFIQGRPLSTQTILTWLNLPSDQPARGSSPELVSVAIFSLNSKPVIPNLGTQGCRKELLGVPPR